MSPADRQLAHIDSCPRCGGWRWDGSCRGACAPVPAGFETSRSRCACGAVDLEHPVLLVGDQAVDDDGLEHGATVCVRQGVGS